MWWSKIYLNYILLCLPLFLLFGVLPAKAINVDFEESEGYVAGTIHGQNNWQAWKVSGTAWVSTSTYVSAEKEAYSGFFSLYHWGVDSQTHAASTTFDNLNSGTQCVRFKFHLGFDHSASVSIHEDRVDSSPVAEMSFNVGDGDDIYINYSGSSHTSGWNVVYDQWNTVCLTWDCGTDKVSYYYNGATSTEYSQTCDTANIVRLDSGWESSEDSYYLYDFLTDSATSSPVATTTKLLWNFPQQDWILNNSEWNDWALDYHLESNDIGDWNILMVHSTDVTGKTITDWDVITGTTDYTAWTIDRSQNYPDGLVWSQAEIVRIDDCVNYWDDDCTWTDIASSSFITWTASSTGYTIFDNPWELPGFYPASTTASSTEEAGWIGQVFQRLKNVFPLSLAFQLQNEFIAIKNNGTNEEQFEFTLNSVLPTEMQLPGSSTLISATSLNTALPIWSTHIYPTLNYLVYAIAVIAIIYILWPKAKQITE